MWRTSFSLFYAIKSLSPASMSVKHIRYICATNLKVSESEFLSHRVKFISHNQAGNKTTAAVPFSFTTWRRHRAASCGITHRSSRGPASPGRSACWGTSCSRPACWSASAATRAARRPSRAAGGKKKMKKSTQRQWQFHCKPLLSVYIKKYLFTNESLLVYFLLLWSSGQKDKLSEIISCIQQ